MNTIAAAAVVLAVAGVVQAIATWVQALASKNGQDDSNAEFRRHNIEVERIMRDANRPRASWSEIVGKIKDDKSDPAADTAKPSPEGSK